MVEEWKAKDYMSPALQILLPSPAMKDEAD
jgi:hypothetical protein